MRPADGYHAVGESLQADVMRFLAIIAFCLIAILALVRNTTPVPSAAATVASSPDSGTPAALGVAPGVVQAPALVRHEAAAAAVVEPVAPLPEAAVASDPEPETPAAAVAPARPGLSLRFASDRDFLRLVNRGTIRVFAFNGREVLRLGDDLQFQPAPAPGPVHELMPRTIPAALEAVLAGGRTLADYRWGVVLPDRVTRAIRRYLDEGAAGELVIDRSGEVRLHAA